MPATAGKLCNGQAFKPGTQESRKGIAEIEGKATRVGANEWSRRAARDIDGKTKRSKWAGAHESTRATSEFQLLLTYSTSSRHGGQAKAGSAAPLATVFCKWSVA